MTPFAGDAGDEPQCLPAIRRKFSYVQARTQRHDDGCRSPCRPVSRPLFFTVQRLGCASPGHVGLRRLCTGCRPCTASRSHRARQAPQRRAHGHPDPDRCLDLHARFAGDQRDAGRRQRATEPGAAAGARSGSGFVRPVPRSRRAQRPAIPDQRPDPARGHQRVRAVARPAPDRVGHPRHRGTARRIWLAHGRHHRRQDEDRCRRAGWRDLDLRRQPWHGAAQHQLRWRLGRHPLLRVGRFALERPGNRIAGWQFVAPARPHKATSRVRLRGRRPRCGEPRRGRRGNVRRHVPDPEPARPAAIAGPRRERTDDLSERGPRREPARDHPLRLPELPALARQA